VKATRREWIGLAVIALPCLVYSMDLTVLFLAIPSISADLRPSSTQLLWISDIYGFMVAGWLITMGTLGDRIGRRRLLLMGATLFGAASVLAAFSRSAAMLIATRALLGVAGATVAPSTLSLIRNMFHDARERTVAISVWLMAYSVGALVAPLLGGVMLVHFWWGSVFLLALPVMVVLLVLGPMLLPEFRDPNAGRLDILSAAMSLGAVLAVIYGLKRIAADGVSSQSIGSIVTGTVIGALFVRRQHRLEHPLIDLELFRSPAFSVSLGTYMVSVFVIFGVGLLIAQYLQLVLGFSPLRAGLWTLPGACGFIFGSMSSPAIIRHFRPRMIVGASLTAAALGFALVTQVAGPSALAFIVTGSTIAQFAISPVVTLATDLIVGSAPPERAGAASAISETSAEFGGALSIAVLGSIGTAVYRMAMASASVNGIAPEIMAGARNTLGGAVALAARLPTRQSTELLELARDAFTHALGVTATISAVLSLVAAIVAVTALRNVRSGGVVVAELARGD
jgi:MFS transporter, DHA2 family, multidrug resistance protein